MHGDTVGVAILILVTMVTLWCQDQYVGLHGDINILDQYNFHDTITVPGPVYDFHGDIRVSGSVSSPW